MSPRPLRLCLFAAAVAACPRQAGAKDDAQLWLGGTVTVDAGGRVRLSQEVVARFSANRRGLYEIESNTMVGYRLDSRVTLWAGYTHDPLYAAGRFTLMEQRAREQVTVDKLPFGPGTLSLRLRLEQRWRDGTAGTGWRLRPFVRYALPLRPGGHTALVFSHESFLDLNRTAFQKVGGEERMRNAVALATPLAGRITAEIGYLNQHGFVPGGPDTSDHVATVTLSASF
ncbi:MAG: DUF2490 domain-containing protein [Alphaproteobacteria bacterium]|nr:DUF2490 domain-containing protein [Alphaproteobacteria bacterium]